MRYNRYNRENEKKNEITIGVYTDQSPFSYYFKEYIGYSLEICQQVLYFIKEQLNLKKRLMVKYQVVTLSTRFDLLLNKSYDMECGSSTNTKER